MKFDLDRAGTRLTKGSHISLLDAAGSTVVVLWGRVWLTQEGDSRDYGLYSGDAMTIRSGGVTLMTALSDAAISILEPSDERVQPYAEREGVGDWAASHAPSGEFTHSRKISADELERYVRRARQLRAQYMSSLFARLGRALVQGLGRLGRRFPSLWARWAGESRTDERNRVSLP